MKITKSFLLQLSSIWMCMGLCILFTSCERIGVSCEDEDNITVADEEIDYPIVLENEAPYTTLWHESYFEMVMGSIEVDVEDFDAEGIWVFSPIDSNDCFKFGKVTSESDSTLYAYYENLVSENSYATAPNGNKIKTSSIAELAEWIEDKTQAGMQVTVKYNKRTHKYVAVAYTL